MLPMVTDAVVVQPLVSTHKRMFSSQGAIANKPVYDLSRNRLGLQGIPEQLDEASATLVAALFSSAAINRISMKEQTLVVEISEQFKWDDVEGWIIACLERRLGLDPSNDATAEIERKTIEVTRDDKGVDDKYVTITSTALLSNRIWIGHGNGITPQLLNERRTDIEAASSELYQMLERMLSYSEVEAVFVNHTELRLKIRSWRIFNEKLERLFVQMMLNYLCWNAETLGLIDVNTQPAAA